MSIEAHPAPAVTLPPAVARAVCDHQPRQVYLGRTGVVVTRCECGRMPVGVGFAEHQTQMVAAAFAEGL